MGIWRGMGGGGGERGQREGERGTEKGEVGGGGVINKLYFTRVVE